MLFERAFPLFAGAPPATRAAAAFAEALEPAVLSGQLQALAPEAMQALVEHFAARGAGGAARVERVVLRLPIASLDLDQIVRLCERHRLHSASLYVLTRINDFRRPLLELLAAVAAARGAGDEAAARALALKLLVWLRGAFRGLAYPPNTGLLPA